MNIREAEKKDCQILAKLSTELGYETNSEDVLRRMKYLENKEGHHIYVASEEENIVGSL